ncbi:MAG TPA: hypothetical protein VK696_01155 [Steroidobacteraceae bacterium]|jgi:hypothetical protein|nr:hypothetical protein [Steroidobacteraceae bacterium]
MKRNDSWQLIPAIIIASLICSDRLAAQTPAPCNLLTAAQVSAVVGASFGAGAPLGASCTWTAPHLIVTLSLKSAGDWQQSKSAGAGPGISKTPVGGLGDDAFSTTLGGNSGRTLETLTVLKGNTAYTFKLYSQAHNQAQQLALEEKLAGAVMSQLAAK